jgi:hypothetical protein
MKTFGPQNGHKTNGDGPQVKFRPWPQNTAATERPQNGPQNGRRRKKYSIIPVACELVVTASVCTPVRCLGCRFITIGCEYSYRYCRPHAHGERLAQDEASRCKIASTGASVTVSRSSSSKTPLLAPVPMGMDEPLHVPTGARPQGADGVCISYKLSVLRRLLGALKKCSERRSDHGSDR